MKWIRKNGTAVRNGEWSSAEDTSIDRITRKSNGRNIFFSKRSALFKMHARSRKFDRKNEKSKKRLATNVRYVHESWPVLLKPICQFLSKGKFVILRKIRPDGKYIFPAEISGILIDICRLCVGLRNWRVA